jgi:restriction endonuclease Mrr
MAIPNPERMIVPVLRTMADGVEHSVEEMRARVVSEFALVPDEITIKQKSGSSILVNYVALALAWLVQNKAIVQVEEGTYKVTDRGATILNQNHTTLSLKDLRSF